MLTTAFPQALFPMGQICITPGALDILTPDAMISLMRRHSSGDWGDMCAEDRAENERSLRLGYRLFSSYKLADDLKVWVITEHDRSYTTLLLPEEY